MYFKDDVHKSQTEFLLQKFGLPDVYSNVEYGSFAYLVGAVYKAKDVVKCFDEFNSIDTERFNKVISVYSSSEKSMLNFALQCFNKSLSDITIADTFWSLDDVNTDILKKAIDIRY